MPQARRPPAPAGAARQRPHPDGDEARLHRARIQEHDPQAARRAARHLRSRATSSSASRAKPTTTSTATMKLIDDVGFDHSFSFIFSPRPGTPAAALADDTPHDVKLARLQRLQAAIEAHGHADQRCAASAPCSAPGGRRIAQGRQRTRGRTRCNRVVNFPGAGAPGRQLVDVRILGSPRPYAARRPRRRRRARNSHRSAERPEADPPAGRSRWPRPWPRRSRMPAVLTRAPAVRR